MHRIEEKLALERDAFLGFRRNDLTVVRVIALDQFGGE